MHCYSEIMNVLLNVSCLLALAAFAVAAPADEGRIVGGANAELGQFPYQVSLRSYGQHFCGGTMVGSKYIVTAAHCNIGPIESMTAVTGSVSLKSGGDTYQVAKFIAHEEWNSQTFENDIAVIVLETRIQTSHNVKSIMLAYANLSDNAVVRTSGWGLTSYPGSIPDALQWIDLKTISAEKCKSLHSGWLADSQICTLTKAGEGVCSGDSGGPLVADGQLVGVTSAAYLCALGYPDFFTRVSSFNKWVDDQIHNNA